MRPPILQWKVMLALLAVVIVGASLGSALHSDATLPRTFYTHGINSGQVGGWTGYTPLSGPPLMTGFATPQMRREECAGLKAMRSRTLKAPHSDLMRAMRTRLPEAPLT